MEEVKQEAQRCKVELLVLPTTDMTPFLFAPYPGN
jgi:hypothetical protein